MDRVRASECMKSAVNGGPPLQGVETLVVPALDRIGEMWAEGGVALSQVYMSGRICEELVDQILPPASPSRKRQPRMAIAVLEDQHLLGKRIVYAILRASGYELEDYGAVELDTLVTRALDDDIELLLVSTLMLPAALRVADLVSALKEAGSDCRVVVGGAPFTLTEDLWKDVGAYAMGATATDAIELASAWRDDGGGQQ
ncbi:MAG: cobalamin-binding protein [Armatimonadia bacterium]|nr:cobalamin-binding protein [Armatimonadia bacterium]